MAEWYAGLDLGQAADYSALAIAEVTSADPEAPEPERRYDLRDLRRYPLGTSYLEIAASVCALLDREPLRSGEVALALDETGVGAPVRDMLERARPRARLVPITITGGYEPIRDGQGWHVPKRDLVSTAQVLLQGRRLRVAPSLPEAATLVRELETFRVKLSDAGHDSYAAWRETDHDDLVLAVSLACWVGENDGPARVW